MFTIPEHLSATCAVDICTTPDCPQRVKQNAETGRWFITISHPGFNSPANNGAGFVSRVRALRTSQRFATPRVNGPRHAFESGVMDDRRMKGEF